MEVYIFLVTMTLLVAFILIGIGICIGRTLTEHERTDSRQLHNNNNNSVLHDRNTRLCTCNLGDNDWK